MTRRHAAALACLVTLAAAGIAGALVVPGTSGAASGNLDQLRSRADRQRAREQSLAASVAQLNGMVSRLQRQLGVLRGRRAALESELAADRSRLAAVRASLLAQRSRLARLRGRLAQARGVLARRLRAIYEASDVDIVTVVLTSHGFADLVDRASYLRRVHDQDDRIIHAVRRAKADATGAVRRLAIGEARQRQVVAGVASQRDAVATLAGAVAQRQAALAQVRAARAAALSAARSDRRQVERRIRTLEAEQARAATQAPAGTGPWAIPWPIVLCESGGQNLPPNGAGASGYYQIIPETWRRSGGSGPAAYLAPKAEQDRVAARIWAQSGAGAWVCGALVG